MTALAAERDTLKYGGDPVPSQVSLLMKGATTIYKGAMVAVTSAGYALPAAATATNVTIGIAQETKTNSGADGAAEISVRCGVFGFENSASSDLIAGTEIGLNCYVVDDNTVAKTSNSSARPVAGKVVKIESSQVFVKLGI